MKNTLSIVLFEYAIPTILMIFSCAFMLLSIIVGAENPSSIIGGMLTILWCIIIVFALEDIEFEVEYGE